jgi:hypothetical protein
MLIFAVSFQSFNDRVNKDPPPTSQAENQPSRTPCTMPQQTPKTAHCMQLAAELLMNMSKPALVIRFQLLCNTPCM